MGKCGRGRGRVWDAEADLHAVGFGYTANMVRRGNSTSDRSLLLVICEALAGEVCRASLRDLDNDGSLDITRYMQMIRRSL